MMRPNAEKETLAQIVDELRRLTRQADSLRLPLLAHMIDMARAAAERALITARRTTKDPLAQMKRDSAA